MFQRIFLSNKLSSEITIIKKFASWNDFPKLIAKSVINMSLVTAQWYNQLYYS